MAKGKLAKYRERRKKKSNPSDIADMAMSIGAGLGGYAVTRFASRMAYSQLVKKYPSMIKHIQVAVSALGAGGVYFGTKHWKKASEHHEAATIGAGVALLQTIAQAYVPKYSWIISDVRPDQYGAKKKRSDSFTVADLPALPDIEPPQLSGGVEEPSFDVDAFLAQNTDIEAVQVGQAPAVESSEDEDFGFADDGDFENYDGLLS